MSRVIRLPYARKNRVWELAIRHSAIESQFIDTRAAFTWSVLLIGRRASKTSRITDETTGETFRLTRDVCCLVPPGVRAHYSIDPDWDFFNLQFNLETFPGRDLFAAQKGIRCFVSPVWRKRLDGILPNAMSTRTLFRLRAALYDFAAENLPPEDMSSPLPAWFDDLQQELRSPQADLSVKVLAGRLGRSVSAFSRGFHEATGESAKHYLDRVLMNRLWEYLRTEKTLGEIARELHFSSEFQLSRFVRRVTGKSPAELRKSMF